MQWNEFIFSDQRRPRFFRHLAFWLTWWVYFWLSSYFFYTPVVLTAKEKEISVWNWNMNDLLRSFFMLSIHLLACYVLLYFLRPKFLQQQKYFSFTAGILLLFGFLFAAGYFISTFIFPLIDKSFIPNFDRARKNVVWASADRGLLSAIKIMVVALVIKSLKYWWIKQKEQEKLEREKLNAELQLLKAQIRPDFLFSTLDNICQYAESSSTKTPVMLIQLSDLLSYMLYDCEAPKVKLEKEIEMLKSYMELEKIRQGEKLDLTIQIHGEINGQMISPLLLLPFIDNSLSYCNSDEEQAWISIEFTIEHSHFSLKLINGLPGKLIYNESTLENVKKRLQLLYPQKHEMKINTDKEMLMVYLKLELEETAQQENSVLPNSPKIKTTLSRAGI
jgi:Histidine kinase